MARHNALEALADTLNSIGDAVACTDSMGNINFLNLVAKEMTGWSQQEAAGRPVPVRHHAEDQR
jgi:PAS domain S-box-containing protein